MLQRRAVNLSPPMRRMLLFPSHAWIVNLRTQTADDEKMKSERRASFKEGIPTVTQGKIRKERTAPQRPHLRGGARLEGCPATPVVVPAPIALQFCATVSSADREGSIESGGTGRRSKGRTLSA